MDIGMRSLHPAAADHNVSIRGSRCTALIMFSLRSWAGDPAYQRWYSNCGDGTWHLRSLLQGTRVTYVTETFPFSWSLRVTSDDRRIGIPTKAPQEAAPSSALCRPPDPSYQGRTIGTGLHRDSSSCGRKRRSPACVWRLDSMWLGGDRLKGNWDVCLLPGNVYKSLQHGAVHYHAATWGDVVDEWHNIWASGSRHGITVH